MQFFSTWFGELGVQRMNLRKRLNESRASLIEFGLLAGLLFGSLGLLTPERGFEVAPWGLAIPAIYLALMLAAELWRQSAVKTEDDRIRVRRGYGRMTGLIGLSCAGAGFATFVFALIHGQPLPPPDIPVPDDLKTAIEATIAR